MSVLPFPLEALQRAPRSGDGGPDCKTTSIHHRTVLLVRGAVAWALGLQLGQASPHRPSDLWERFSLGKLASHTRDRLLMTPHKPDGCASGKVLVQFSSSCLDPRLSQHV